MNVSIQRRKRTAASRRTLLDIKTGKLLVETPPFGFKEEIENLLSGKSWENELKEIDKIQPPLLKQENCD